MRVNLSYRKCGLVKTKENIENIEKCFLLTNYKI